MCYVLIGFNYDGDDPVLIAKKDTQDECEILEDAIVAGKQDYEEKVEGIRKAYQDETASSLGITNTVDYRAYLVEQTEKRKHFIAAIPEPPYNNLDYFHIF